MKQRIALPFDAQLNPFFHLLAILEAHHIFQVSGLRVKQTTKFDSSLKYLETCYSHLS